jgi:hypothetical protein
VDLDLRPLFVALTAVGCLLGAPALVLLLVERKWRWRWQEVEETRVAISATDLSPYRESGTVPVYLTRAPGLIRFCAYTCFLFGQMFVPGLCLGICGAFVAGVGIVSIPGLITAGKLFSAGLALLRRDPKDAYYRTREAARWALWLNGIIFVVSIVILSVVRDHSFWWPLLGFMNGYGLCSVLQACLCMKATSRYEDALFVPIARYA